MDHDTEAKTTEPAPMFPFTLESLIGRTLDDRYQIDELIGMGAMGAVFRARQLRLRRTVAIKVPKPQYCTDREFLARFEREALSMAKLIHEHVVQTIDVYISADPTTPSFIAMEYVEGIELEKFLRSQEEKLTISAVTELFCQIARGIDAAHARGIVHRDIKPSNIIVTMPHRVAKIMDFGIARVEMEDVFATTDEAVIGTPAFMAPEQIKGGPITSAADIYAFGMTLYRLLTRNIAFPGGSSSALLYSQANDPPIDVIERNPLLPAAIRRALMPALAKDPGKRPSSATQLANDLRAALEPLATQAYAELFPDDTETVIDKGRPPETAATFPVRKVLAAGAVFVFLLVVASAGILMSGGGAEDGVPPVAAEGNAPIDATREPATNPPATLAPPEEIEGASAEPAPVVATETPIAATPEPSPEKTPLATNPPPTERPRQTTETPPPPTTTQPATPKATTAAPQIGITAATNEADAYQWNPAMEPPLDSGRELRRVQAAVRDFLTNEVERPLHYRQWDRVALAEATEPLARRLLDAIRRDSARFDPVDIRLLPNGESQYWGDRALVRLDLRISGRPNDRPERDYRERIFHGDNVIEMKVLLAEDGVRLLSFSGDERILRPYLPEGQQ